MKILVSFIGCETGNIICINYEKKFQDTGTLYSCLVVSVCEVICDEPKISFG
jgi:hypothetical protein